MVVCQHSVSARQNSFNSWVRKESLEVNRDYPRIDCDILIVGGGSAGAMAAIRAKEMNPRQQVVVLER
jgi:ribulose 1,5-bisphosphate synthetase/thiazole synthase